MLCSSEDGLESEEKVICRLLNDVCNVDLSFLAGKIFATSPAVFFLNEFFLKKKTCKISLFLVARNCATPPAAFLTT